jgi:hypothetical protein
MKMAMNFQLEMMEKEVVGIRRARTHSGYQVVK